MLDDAGGCVTSSDADTDVNVACILRGISKHTSPLIHSHPSLPITVPMDVLCVDGV